MNLFKKKNLNMIWELALAEFRLRDQGSFLGFIWTLLHPLIYFIVLYGLFKKWMGNHIDNFPLYLIIGIIQWNFFSSATTNCIDAVKRQGNYVRNLKFPRESLVFSSVLAVVFSHVGEIIMLLLLWFFIAETITPFAFLLGAVVLLNIYLTVGVGFILAVIGVYFLDIRRIWSILMSVGFFLTPVFYSMELIASEKRIVLLANPITHIITASRDILINGSLPRGKGLLYVFLIATVMFAAGYCVFKKYEDYFVEKI